MGIWEDCISTITKVEAKGIDVLNKQSEPKHMQNVGQRVIQGQAHGIAVQAVLRMGSGKDDGQDEEVKPPTCHAKLHKRFILEPVDYVFEEFIWKMGEYSH